MKSNRILWIIIVILFASVVAMLIYGIQQYDDTESLIQRLETEKTELSEELDSIQTIIKTKNMAAYVIFIKEKTIDKEELKIYSQKAPEGLVGYDITTLAAYGKNQVIEGDEVEGVAILEFPSFEEAKAWYENPIYQKAKEHRVKGGKYRAIIVEGINK